MLRPGRSSVRAPLNGLSGLQLAKPHERSFDDRSCKLKPSNTNYERGMFACSFCEAWERIRIMGQERGTSGLITNSHTT